MLLICGFFASCLYSAFFLPKKGLNPVINPTYFPIMWNGMIIIPVSSTKAIHIHHWVVYILICMLSLFVYIPTFIVGFSFGLFLQGIWYEDFDVFICDNPY